MTALAADRNTPERAGDQFVYPVAATTLIYAGSIVMLNAAGDATKGATATGQICVGRAEQQVNNTGAAAAATISVSKGVFRWANSTAGDAITKAEIGDNCYIVDDQTVAKTDATGTRSVAGKIVDVDSSGVWVLMV